jgi:hypothetical protein
MPLNTAILKWGGRKLLPLYDPEDAQEERVNLPPNVSYPLGTILGQITVTQSDVQTLTMGTATGGTFTLGTDLGNTAPVAVAGISAATILSALVALFGPGNVTVTGTGPFVVTFAGQYANRPVTLMTITSAVTGGTAPTIAHTTQGRTAGTFGAYAAGNADGTQTAKCILSYDCATDAAGNVTIGGTAAGGSTFGETYPTAPAYFSGIFDTKELVGLDAAGAGQLGRLWSGTVADGVLKVN